MMQGILRDFEHVVSYDEPRIPFDGFLALSFSVKSKSKLNVSKKQIILIESSSQKALL